MNTSKLVVYGSLMQGFWNYNYFLADAEFVGKDTISGYALRSHDHYPAIFEASPDSQVHVEVYELENVAEWQERLARIHSMEVGAGYFRRLLTTDHGQEAWAFVMPTEHVEWFPYSVDSGDWRDFIAAQKKEASL